eukprot:s2443_g16.t1
MPRSKDESLVVRLGASDSGEGLPSRSQVASSSEKKLSLGHNMRRQVPALSAIEENLNADEPGREQGERARPSSSRSAGPPCAPATSSRMSNSRSAMRDAADEALARALAQVQSRASKITHVNGNTLDAFGWRVGISGTLSSAMAADPTPDEMTAMVDVQKAMAWAGFDTADLAETTVPGSLLKHFGLKPTSPPRIVGVFPDADLQAMLTAWRVPVAGAAAQAPTLAESGMAKLFCRACQLVAGTGQTLQELKAMAATSTAPSVTAPAVTPGSSTQSRKIKLSSVVSQVDDSEILVAEEKEILKCYGRYEQVFGTGERPAKDCEPTAEQLSSLIHLIGAGQPPYVDFSVFGPFGHRMMKRIKLSGYNIERDGTLKMVELYGPNNLGAWLQSYNVLLTCLVMVDAVDLGHLQKYKSHIERMAERYGPRVWSVIYQADVRCRLEQMERLKRKLKSEHDQATSSGGTTDYDDKRPWNMVWARAVSDEGFWREEVVEPCMLILTKITSPGEVLDGDAKVASAPASSSGQREVTPAPARMTAEKAIRPRNANRTGRVHNIQDGKYTHNRTGYAICAGYNSGQCTASTQGIWCSQQWDTVHQCDRCLGAHPSSRCPHADLQTPGFVKNAKGGKKGRGRGGKGKRPPY